MMKNITLKLIKDFPFLFKNTSDFPAITDPNIYLEHFQKKIDAKLIAFTFPDMFELDILNILKDNIYNSFYLFRNETASLVTYMQFDVANHAMIYYCNNQKTNKEGALFTFYVKDHSFVLDFIKKHENLIIGEEKAVGFLNVK